MQLEEKNGVRFYKFPNLAKYPEISHGVFTRKGGVSTNEFSSLNVGMAIGDDDFCVIENRKIILECMEGQELVSIKQVHGCNVAVLSFENPYQKQDTDEFMTADAIITTLHGKMLLIKTADCQSIMLYDPVKKAIANIHSGWRGTVQNIIGETVRLMEKQFGCNPKQIEAGITPSLGPCCAEFINYKNEIPVELWRYKKLSDYFDFWSISCEQLVMAGVLRDNICVSKICTKCNTDLFFSYRAEKITGRFATVIGLK